MSKHLMLNGGAENWLLAETVDLDGLRATIEAAMTDGTVLQMPVYIGDRPDAPVTLLLNAKAAASVVLVEL